MKASYSVSKYIIGKNEIGEEPFLPKSVLCKARKPMSTDGTELLKSRSASLQIGMYSFLA